MRLKKIKLAGFKSFVDPTVLELRSNLVAVVGPNGCGKSNVIDAVRWVMGESSAKNLRGESSTDVIFNGSTSRKPVGQAAVELQFDNTDGKLGGEYAQYAEIAVRREISRDGESSYFLNGSRCRRRDVTDIFLGTGLGPRSYAIIEQGMITRIIVGRAEDLRAFIEEAAGIGLYKKRRHETETRMRHTKENLTRLEDLRQEQEKQLERLKRQAEAAARFKELQAEEKIVDAELSALRWQNLNSQRQEHASRIQNLSLTVEARLAERSHIDLNLEKLRQSHIDKAQILQQSQSRHFEIGTQISRTEQSLQHQKERQRDLSQDLAQLSQNTEEAVRQLSMDKERLADLRASLAELGPQEQELQSLTEQTKALWQDSDQAMRRWNEGWDMLQQSGARSERKAEVEKARIEQLEKQNRDFDARAVRLQQERLRLDDSELCIKLEDREQERLCKEAEMTGFEAELRELRQEVQANREKNNLQARDLDQLQGKFQTQKGRQASLQALQQAALNNNSDQRFKEWLATTGLTAQKRLAELIQVKAGYEQALETVLSRVLGAICISSLPEFLPKLATFSEGQLSLLATTQHQHRAPAAHMGWKLLADFVISPASLPGSLNELLAGVYVVDNQQQAEQLLPELLAGESLITLDGLWLGSNWLLMTKDLGATTGVLERERELQALSEEVTLLEEQLGDLSQALTAGQERLRILEIKLDESQKAQQKAAHDLNTVISQSLSLKTQLQQLNSRATQIALEEEEIQLQIKQINEEIAVSRMILQDALEGMAEFTDKKSALFREKENLQSLLAIAAQKRREHESQLHALALQRQTLNTQIQGIDQGLGRLTQHYEQLLKRRSTLEDALAQVAAPEIELKFQLEELLEKRLFSEQALTEARTILEAADLEMRSLEKNRIHLEQQLESIRDSLNNAQLEWQASEVHCENIEKLLADKGLDPKAMVAGLPADMDEASWHERLLQIQNRLQRLGAINLAAIEEYQLEAERKLYLDAQFNDLTEALQTLDAAIEKIDKETRSRFKDTFDKVQAGFQNLFPRLFGGGQAYLELTGQDLLESGVTVMARPPGKRNSSIHLLSGGEKALTAVALVFAIFQLNPAPFCMLDEVDAPLDDANVGRFCSLVKHMSETVQFIFITHNKLAMEMAIHLSGVTMKEPGVSRLVSVDIEEATALVEASA